MRWVILIGSILTYCTPGYAAQTEMDIKANIKQCTVDEDRGCIICPGLTDYSNSPLPKCDD